MQFSDPGTTKQTDEHVLSYQVNAVILNISFFKFNRKETFHADYGYRLIRAGPNGLNS